MTYSDVHMAARYRSAMAKGANPKTGFIGSPWATFTDGDVLNMLNIMLGEGPNPENEKHVQDLLGHYRRLNPASPQNIAAPGDDLGEAAAARWQAELPARGASPAS